MYRERFGLPFGATLLKCCNHLLAMSPVKRRNRTRQPMDQRTKSKGRGTQKKISPRILSFADRLIGPEPTYYFTDNCEKTLTGWIELLSHTNPPADINISSSDHRWAAVFQKLDDILVGRQGTYLLRRLAFVQHKRISDLLQEIVRSERENGTGRGTGIGDASVVMDIYKTAQENRLHPSKLNNAIDERRRTSRHWEMFAGPSPLFLLIYSEVAETVV